MPRESDFRSTVTSLWFRLITLGILGLVFAEALSLAQGEAQGWTFYLTTSEVAFEVVVRLVFAALAGIALGTLCTAAIAPFLWHFKSSRERIAEWATKVAVVLVVFLDSRFALTSLIKSWWPNHGPGFTSALLTAHFLVFARGPLHSSRTERSGDQYRRLPWRKDDATHGDCDSRRHCCAGGHGICSQQDGAGGKGSTGFHSGPSLTSC